MKNKVHYIIGENSVSLIVNGKAYNIIESDLRYAKIMETLRGGNLDDIPSVLTGDAVVKSFLNESEEVEIRGGKVFYHGFEIKNVVSEKLLAMLKEGFTDGTRFVKFLKNLLANPSKQSVEELYDFMSYKSLPIDEDGFVIGYKGVQDNFYSVHGNKETIVTSGKVDSNGRIYNGVGEKISVMRNQVDDDRANECSTGLHVGSKDYADNWGAKTVLVRFNPANAVSVPKDCSFQKLRVCEYEVIAEIPRGQEHEIKTTVYNEKPEEKAPKYKYPKDDDYMVNYDVDYNDEWLDDFETEKYVSGVRKESGSKNELGELEKQKIEQYLNRAFSSPTCPDGTVLIKNVQKACKGVTCKEIVNFIRQNMNSWVEIHGDTFIPSTCKAYLKH